MLDDQLMMTQEIQSWLSTRPFIVATNRAPFIHEYSDRGCTAQGQDRSDNDDHTIPRPIRVHRSVGGVVSALEPVLAMTQGIWVAWGSGSADRETADENGTLMVPPESPKYRLRRVFPSPAQARLYYDGFCNQLLWPLGAMDLSQVVIHPAHWPAYKQVNELFAEAVSAELTAENAATGIGSSNRGTPSKSPLVWFHDYHLALAPRYLRRRHRHALILHYWHIPWPPWDIFRVCPQLPHLIDGLLACDLVAFHLPRYVHNFLDCAARELPVAIDRVRGTVTYRGHTTYVRSQPLGIDFTAWQEWARLSPTSPVLAGTVPTPPPPAGTDDATPFNPTRPQIALSVDRLDYAKGILERLHAFRLLLERSPGWRERVVLVQQVAPSRINLPAYRELARRIESSVAQINARFRTERWLPVLHLSKPLHPKELAALYRQADIMIACPLRDGMNLVAKEFVASQIDQRGVLLLSAFAGAAAELKEGPVHVNPYDTHHYAGSIERALTMPLGERRQRMLTMRSYLSQHDIYHWLGNILSTAAEIERNRRIGR